MKARLTCHSLLALSIAALLPAGSALAATTSGGTVNFSGGGDLRLCHQRR